MNNLTLENAQAELVRLERMTEAARRLVARLQASSNPTYLRPRSQDRTLAPPPPKPRPSQPTRLVPRAAEHWFSA